MEHEHLEVKQEARWGRRYNLWLILAVAAVALCAVVFLAARGQSLQDQIIGKWRAEGQALAMEFFPSGDVQIVVNKQTLPTCKFNWIDADHVKIETHDASFPGSIFKVQISGDTMTNTGQSGRVEVWQRVKE